MVHSYELRSRERGLMRRDDVGCQAVRIVPALDEGA
jgi:hypothetical protein